MVQNKAVGDSSLDRITELLSRIKVWKSGNIFFFVTFSVVDQFFPPKKEA